MSLQGEITTQYILRYVPDIDPATSYKDKRRIKVDIPNLPAGSVKVRGANTITPIRFPNRRSRPTPSTGVVNRFGSRTRLFASVSFQVADRLPRHFRDRGSGWRRRNSALRSQASSPGSIPIIETVFAIAIPLFPLRPYLRRSFRPGAKRRRQIAREARRQNENLAPQIFRLISRPFDGGQPHPFVAPALILSPDS